MTDALWGGGNQASSLDPPIRFDHLAVPFFLPSRQGPSVRKVPRHHHWNWYHRPLVSFSGGGLRARFARMVFRSVSLNRAEVERQERHLHFVLSLASSAQVWL